MFTITRSFEIVRLCESVDVIIDVWPAERGSWDSPGCDAQAEVISIGTPIDGTLTDEEEERIAAYFEGRAGELAEDCMQELHDQARYEADLYRDWLAEEGGK